MVISRNSQKTTLVKLITKKLAPLEGEVTIGTNVDISSFDQLQAEVLDPRRTVIEEFKTIPTVDADGRNPRTYLASFGFRGDAVDRRVGDLSGGEQTRLALAKVLAVPVNLLILDEPTNHLDVGMIEWLEDYLSAQKLTLLLVTHDRYFLDAVCNEIVEIDEEKVFVYKGTYDYFLEQKSGMMPSKFSVLCLVWIT